MVGRVIGLLYLRLSLSRESGDEQPYSYDSEYEFGGSQNLIDCDLGEDYK